MECVVNYDVPTHIKTYVHRVGRTARAGKEVRRMEREGGGEVGGDS